MDPAALRGIAANEAVLDALGSAAELAEPSAGPSPYALDAFVLHAHPDLCDRLLEVSEGIDGTSAVGVFGLPCLVDRGRILRAYARGTSSLWLRLAASTRGQLGPDEAWPATELGPDWVRVDAWQTVRPSAEGTAWVRRLVAAAFELAEAADA